jgi:hypothetical protein
MGLVCPLVAMFEYFSFCIIVDHTVVDEKNRTSDTVCNDSRLVVAFARSSMLELRVVPKERLTFGDDRVFPVESQLVDTKKKEKRLTIECRLTRTVGYMTYFCFFFNADCFKPVLVIHESFKLSILPHPKLVMLYQSI